MSRDLDAKISVSSATMAKLLHKISVIPRDVGGLLFGTCQQERTYLATDRDDNAYTEFHVLSVREFFIFPSSANALVDATTGAARQDVIEKLVKDAHSNYKPIGIFSHRRSVTHRRSYREMQTIRGLLELAPKAASSSSPFPYMGDVGLFVLRLTTDESADSTRRAIRYQPCFSRPRLDGGIHHRAVRFEVLNLGDTSHKEYTTAAASPYARTLDASVMPVPVRHLTSIDAQSAVADKTRHFANSVQQELTAVVRTVADMQRALDVPRRQHEQRRREKAAAAIAAVDEAQARYREEEQRQQSVSPTLSTTESVASSPSSVSSSSSRSKGSKSTRSATTQNGFVVKLPVTKTVGVGSSKAAAASSSSSWQTANLSDEETSTSNGGGHQKMDLS